jgi:hypothetical protein
VAREHRGRTLASRSSWPQPTLPEIRRRIPEITQDRARGPMQSAGSDRGRVCRLELRRHGRDKLRATVGVDRRGQTIQHCTLGVGEGRRHEGVFRKGI